MQQRKILQSEATLARFEAREIQRANPAIFQQVPVSLTELKALAKILGLTVEKRSDLHQRARLEVLTNGATRAAIIAVRADLDKNVSRFAIAHEIGHAVLLRKHPKPTQEWDVSRREVFANTFAAEILTSAELRANIEPSFRSLNDPLALVRLASDVGLSPRALLTIASQERSWIANLNRIWLRVKYIENAYTHREPKLRIVSAYYDRHRFFVATNQSLTRFAGDDQWLACLPVGVRGRTLHHYFGQP